MKLAFTMFFLTWEAGKRVKGAWRRREWRTLTRFALRMVAVVAIVAGAAVACTGCTVVPTGTAYRTCELLEITSDEADMAPAWYLDAGVVLERCGRTNARAEVDTKACFASARNGYRDSAECEALP